jgi:ribosome-binding protein aMBF1 (putative translation factor)
MQRTHNVVRSDTTVSRFGSWLVAELEQRGMSQSGLSSRLSTSRNTVYRWIKGDITPDPESCRKLGRVLGIDPMEVLAQAGHVGIIDDARQQLIELVRSLPDERLNDARLYLHYLLKRPLPE